MRVLVSTQPAPSHFGPLVPYLEALREAGHEVLVACAASFTGAVEDKGFAAVACGLDWLEVEAAKTFPEVSELDGRGKLLFSLRHMFGGVLADAFARDLPAVIEDWGADVLLWE
ncbi:MAG TPA: hypothetical protein VNU01_00005, partial [Egibacteraceae bacterium]|nr:hypothetical protein [Egibacteraceae bacterium]